jgi:hypothetical protein
MRANPFEPLIDEDRIAAHFGLEKLELGRHVFSDGDGGISHEVYLHAFWSLTIRPPLQSAGILAAAILDDQQGRGRTQWLLRCEGSKTIQSVSLDGLAALQFVAPLLRQGPVHKEGIRYQLRILSGEVNCQASLSNPESPEWWALQDKCLEVATMMAVHSGDQRLQRFVSHWREYIVPKK